MNLNNTLSSAYRLLAITFLVGIFLIAASYASLVVFFVISSSWGTPLILSPSQAKVLSFQPQVANLVLNINKQKAELKSALLVKQNILEQLINIDSVALKIESAMSAERNRTTGQYITLDTLVKSKEVNIEQSKKVLDEIKTLNRNIDAELEAKLITSDQAAQRRISVQTANNAFTELNVSSEQLAAQSTQLKDYAVTLGGKPKSLTALVPTKQLMELEALKSQLKLQLITSEQNVEIVRKAMASDNRILQVAMDSPYYRALWAATPVLFIPYDNIHRVEASTPIYDCVLQIIICRQVGTIEKLFDAEEYAKHPLFKTDLKGKLATLILTDKSAANSNVLFIGSKPLFI